jgi:hypothetical protein
MLVGRTSIAAKERKKREEKSHAKTQRRKVKAESKLFTGGHDGPVRKHV